ncbi:g8799 [Coccomyxa elongata]
MTSSEGNSISSQPKEETKNVSKQGTVAAALSGSVSGAIISTCVQPLDVVRTRMQADATKNAFSGMLGTFRSIVSEEGVRALWRGTGPTIARLSVGLGIQMYVLESLKDAFYQRHLHLNDKQGQKLTKAEAFLAGGVARAAAAAATCPFTVVKTRMEYAGSRVQYTGTLSALRSISRVEGIGGLFRGLGPTILTNAPFSAFYYLFYTSLQDRMQQNGASKTVTNLTSGAVAAVCATLLTQPTDMLRTHMQLGLGRGGAALNVMDTWNAVVGGSMGYRALLVGALPRVVKRTMQTALVWTLYEELQPAFKQALQSASSRGQNYSGPAP